MISQIEKQILFWAICLFLGTVLANVFWRLLPYGEEYLNTRHFKSETKELALLIKQYSTKHADYSALNIDAFTLDELPRGIYKNVNDEDLESIKGKRVSIFGASSSRYQQNKNAYVIAWRDIDAAACRALIRQDWKDIPNVSFLGFSFAVNEQDLREDEIYAGCSGALHDKGIVACPKGDVLTAPLNSSDAKKICECPSGHCQMLLKFM